MNDRTIVVVNADTPVLMPWADQVAAIGCCWLPGQAMGDALADVLLGRAGRSWSDLYPSERTIPRAARKTPREPRGFPLSSSTV
ncbi:MAG TPA: glycoside hydrolase family 3 C-terminal domain-containing protein [Streptosporangiaceae bacterium]|nr:glycoside hydrolase family 3 C-terminal domain-containing protein [Streptosporangiaceae bacterium]